MVEKSDFEQIVSDALSYISSLVGGWPEDDWISIGENWDLNLFYDPLKNRHCANLHPVVRGFTQSKEKYVIME